MKKTGTRSTKRQPVSGVPYLLVGGAIFCATVAAVMFGRMESSVPSYIALGGGAALGTWLFRFGTRHAWIALLCLCGSLVIFVVLAAYSDLFGSTGIAWLGSFIAGTNAGAGWRIEATRPSVADLQAEWRVNGTGYGTASLARDAASAAVTALDGNTRWSLSVEHETARLEIAGNARAGLVCHRSPLAGRDAGWAVLGRQGHAGDAVVEVPMGEMKATLPLHLVHDLATVEDSLAEFFRNPESSALGEEWTTGNLAIGTRLQ